MTSRFIKVTNTIRLNNPLRDTQNATHYINIDNIADFYQGAYNDEENNPQPEIRIDSREDHESHGSSSAVTNITYFVRSGETAQQFHERIEALVEEQDRRTGVAKKEAKEEPKNPRPPAKEDENP